MRAHRRRSDIEIIADMLRLGEAGKTEIMYSANMSYFQLQKYLGFLTSHGFIVKVRTGNPSVTYQATRSGFELLKSINEVTEMLALSDDDKFNGSRVAGFKIT